MKKPYHNAHMLIPLKLWKEAKKLTEELEITMTEFVCAALANELRRNQ